MKSDNLKSDNLISRTTFTREAVRAGLAIIHRVHPDMVQLSPDLPEVCGWVDDVPKPKKTGRKRGRKITYVQDSLPLD
jgi:hypothetical protein